MPAALHGFSVREREQPALVQVELPPVAHPRDVHPVLPALPVLGDFGHDVPLKVYVVQAGRAVSWLYPHAPAPHLGDLLASALLSYSDFDVLDVAERP